MIALMRKALKGDAYRYILWTFMFIMAFGSGAVLFFFQDNTPKDWVVRVYNESLTEPAWRSSLLMVQRQRDMFKQYGIVYEHPYTPAQEALRMQLSTLLLNHESSVLGIAMPDSLLQKELASQLKNLPAHFFRKDGSLDVERFEEQIAPQTLDDFMNSIKQQAQSHMLEEFLLLDNYVTHDELVLQYNEEYANKKYSVISLSETKFIAEMQKKGVTDQQLQAYYKEIKNDAMFKTDEKRAGQYWTFAEQHYDITVSEKELKAAYEKQKQEKYLITPAKVQVRRLVVKDEGNGRELIEELHSQATTSPESFKELIKKHSADKKSIEHGGVTEFFDRDSKLYDHRLVKAAFEQLHKDGQISQVVRTKDGFEILQRVERKQAEHKSFDAVKALLEKELRAEKFKKRFLADASRVASAANYEADTLTKFIEKKAGKHQDLSLRTRGNGAIEARLFTVAQGRYIAFIDQDQGVLLQCTQIDKSVIKPFETVKDEVKDAWFKKQGQEALKKAVQTVVSSKHTQEFDRACKEYNGVLSTAHFTYNRQDGSSDISEILKRASVAAVLNLLMVKGNMVAVQDKTEYLIIRLDEIDPIDKELFESKEASMRTILANNNKFKAHESFVASLYRHATINNKIEIKKEIEQLTKI